MKCAIHSYIYYARTILNCPEKYDVTKVMAMYNSFKRNLIQVSNKNGLQLMIMRIMKIAILGFERSSSFVYTIVKENKNSRMRVINRSISCHFKRDASRSQ